MISDFTEQMIDFVEINFALLFDGYIRRMGVLLVIGNDSLLYTLYIRICNNILFAPVPYPNELHKLNAGVN